MLITSIIYTCNWDCIVNYFSYIQYTRTPLHLAAIHGHADAGEMLIKLGAYVDAGTKVSIYYNVNLLYSTLLHLLLDIPLNFQKYMIKSYFLII